MVPLLNRRHWIATAASASAVVSIRPQASQANSSSGPADSPFRFCLNTGTLLGHKLPLERTIDIAARAGYAGIEPWIREIQQYVEQGGRLVELRRRISDQGLSVEGAIGFASWIGDDDAQRAAGFEQFKRDMDLVAQIGGKRIAAAPSGATKTAVADLDRVVERYRKLLDLGQQFGVVPQLEPWGRSRTLSRLGEVAYVLAESGHPWACALLDVFHLYRSGSDFEGLRAFSRQVLHVVHVNDYPADPPREKATDADRIYPGDGIAPYGRILQNLADVGFQGFLSLELFNKTYWQQEPLQVARTGLEKMRTVVARWQTQAGK